MSARRRSLALASISLLLIAVVLPLLPFVDSYVLSVLIVALFAAYFGQAWNVVTGFAGQLSLGHALYVGLGAYVSALLWFYFGIGPWLGVFAAVAAAMTAGAVVGWLGFRFGVEGVISVTWTGCGQRAVTTE